MPYNILPTLFIVIIFTTKAWMGQTNITYNTIYSYLIEHE